MKKLIFAIALVILSFYALAEEFPKAPNPPRLVNDFAKVLNKQQNDALEYKLRRYNDSTSSEVSIVLIRSTGPYDIAQYAYELGERWGIGKKDKNNGLLLLVAVTDRKVNISTGYGMEPVVPDAAAHRIIEDYLKPQFRNNNYYAGLDEATTVIFKLATGEFKADAIAKGSGSPGAGSWMFVIFLVLVFVIFPALKHREVNKSHYGHKHKDVDFLTTMILLNGMGRRRGSSYSDFSRGGGIFGGGGGGGSSFGGFGGGSFGGGGASGSW
jgi:uncharacterized protein